MRRLATILLWLAICAGAYFGGRAAFLAQPPIGEEGIFANLFYSRPAGPAYLLLGRIDGREIREPFNHPAPPYELLSALGGVARAVFGLRTFQEWTWIFVARLAFAGFLFVVLFLLGLAVLTAPEQEKRPLLLALILAAGLSPLAISSSVNLYLDGSVGALAAGLFALAVGMEIRGRGGARARLLLVGLTAFGVGLGKQEWSLALVGAAVATAVVWRVVFRTKTPHAALLLVAVAGCVGGNLASYGFDPVNYLGHLTFYQNADQLPWSGLHPTRALLARLWILLAPLFLAALGAWFAARRRTPAALLGYWFALFLLLGFLPNLATAGFAFRYFAPALAALIVAVVLLAPEKPGRIQQALLAAGVVVFTVQFAFFRQAAVERHLSVTDGFGLPVAAYFPQKAQMVAAARARGCVPILPAWVKFQFPETDFVIPSVDAAAAERLISERGKALCRD